MDNFLDIINQFSNISQHHESKTNNIPKEILDQYPYGEFPLRYTKSGQEAIRKSSENRFSYSDSVQTQSSTKELSQNNDSSNLSMLIPIIQILSNQKKQPKDIFQLFAKLFFKDNPEMEKLFQLIPNISSQTINNTKNQEFETNKVNINSLQKIN